MSNNIKPTIEERIIEGELKLFSKILAKDPNIQEVNFDKNTITYTVQGYEVSVELKTKKKYGTERKD